MLRARIEKSDFSRVRTGEHKLRNLELGSSIWLGDASVGDARFGSGSNMVWG